MIVEIAGVDGSGKTTLIHHLRRRINEETRCWAYERSFKSSSTRLLEQIALNEGKSRAYESFDPSLIEFTRALELVRISSEELYPARLGNRQLYFVDNYVAESLARIIYRRVSIADDIRKVLNYVPKPDFSFYLSILPELAFERLSARAKGDALLSEVDPIDTLSRWVKSFNEARDMLSYDQINLDASEPVGDLVDKVLALLRKVNGNLHAINL